MTNSSTVSDTDLQALDRARNAEDGHVDPETTAILESAIAKIWASIQRNPDSYVLDPNEFAIFNFFRKRFSNSVAERAVTERAVQRFWDSYRGRS